MKRIVLLTLLAVAAPHIAFSADEKAEKQLARRTAAVSKPVVARGPSQQPRVAARPQIQRPNPNFAAQSVQANQRRTFDANLSRQARTPRVITSNGYSGPKPELQAEIAARNNYQTRIARQNSQNQGQWNGNNNQSGNWRNNNGGSGNWQGNNDGNNNWGNRGENWRRRHGHWNRNHRDRSWWRSNYSRFALFGGGYYYWNSGYWYPAYGYDPYFSTYTYDAPIYAYNDQDPGQVISNVQVELQRRGYNPGGVDGSYGPMTRSALIRYQGDNGLPVTGEIDEDTLNSLGLQ